MHKIIHFSTAVYLCETFFLRTGNISLLFSLIKETLELTNTLINYKQEFRLDIIVVHTC